MNQQGLGSLQLCHSFLTEIKNSLRILEEVEVNTRMNT